MLQDLTHRRSCPPWHSGWCRGQVHGGITPSESWRVWGSILVARVMVKSWISQNHLLMRCNVGLGLVDSFFACTGTDPLGWDHSVGGGCTAPQLGHGRVHVQAGES